MSYTGQRQAAFTTYHAARNWPFQEDWVAKQLPSPMDIDGPMVSASLNLVEVNLSTTILQFLQKIDKDKKLLNEHSHAPLLAVQERLGQDGKHLLGNMRRQVFNWLAPLTPLHQLRYDANVSIVQVISRSDVGLLWNCRMADKQTIQINASYDDAQLRWAEVEEALGPWTTCPDSQLDHGPVKLGSRSWQLPRTASATATAETPGTDALR